MGNGLVALILDVAGIARRARIHSEARRRAPSATGKTRAESALSLQTLLIVHVGNRRLGIRLDQVSRLEEFSPDTIELSQAREVVQYCGQIMPLVRLHQVFGVAANERPDQNLKVIVHQHEDRRVGFVVDRIGDIVETAIDSDEPDSGHGAASIVVQQRVTDLIDLDSLLGHASAGPCAATTAAEGASA
jgi:two-component system chemotaxis sensor kinase CheA